MIMPAGLGERVETLWFPTVRRLGPGAVWLMGVFVFLYELVTRIVSL
jgi:hypothetical protein